MTSLYKRCAAALIFLAAGAGQVFATETPEAILLAAGDITGCSSDELQRSAMTAEVLGREIDLARKSGVPVKVAILGDIAYGSGTEKQFACFEKTWGKMLGEKLANANDDVLPVPGNHEYKTPGGTGFFMTFKDNTWIKSGSSGYYQVTLPGTAGDWRLFGLNSEIDDGVSSAQYGWLDTSLAASPEACILAFWHRPVFSSGPHGRDDGGHLVKRDAMSDIEALLSSGGASVVLNGHDHDYEELAPHDESGHPSPDGLRSFIAGTGGKELYHESAGTWPSISHNYDSGTYGVLKLELYPGKYAWNFLPSAAGAAAKYAGEGACNRRK